MLPTTTTATFRAQLILTMFGKKFHVPHCCSSLTMGELQVRRHSGLMKFDSVTQSPFRLSRHRNFNNFAEDVNEDALPQWVWVTPNIVNVRRFRCCLTFFSPEASPG